MIKENEIPTTQIIMRIPARLPIFEISEKASLNPSKEIPIFSSWLEEKSKDGFIQVPVNPVFTKTIPINRAITAADKASFSSSN